MIPWWRRPWIHFVVLGGILFGVSISIREPAPLPSLPQPSAEQIESMRLDWVRRTNTLPGESQTSQFTEDWIERELLFREALRLNLELSDMFIWRRLIRNLQFIGAEGSDASLLRKALRMGLHKEDIVVRRRLLQAMEDRARSSLPMPDEQVLRHAYKQALEDEFVRKRRTFSHVYYSYDKRGKIGARNAANRFACSKEAIAIGDGDIYAVAPKHVPLSTETQIAKNFGPNFAHYLMHAPVNACSGPINSAYGTHWVYVNMDRSDIIPYETARPVLMEDWLRVETSKVLQDQARQLRKHYQLPLP